MSVVFDKKSHRSFLKIDSSKIKSLRDYEVDLKLVSAKGRYQNYLIKLNFTKSNRQIVSAKIASIDKFGVAIV